MNNYNFRKLIKDHANNNFYSLRSILIYQNVESAIRIHTDF